MYAPRLSGMTAGVALACAVALSAPVGALAQTGQAPEVSTSTEAVNPFAPVDTSAAAGVPVPDLTELPPLTPADVADRKGEAGSPAITAAPSVPVLTEVGPTAPAGAPPTTTASTPPAPQLATRPADSQAAKSESTATVAPASSRNSAAPVSIPAAAAAAAGAAQPPTSDSVAAPRPSDPVGKSTAPAANMAAAPSGTTPPIDVQRAIPVPEAANVPPPTAADIGVPPMHPADAVLAARLKDLLEGKVDRILDRKADRAAVEEFYKTRNYQPVWFERGMPTERMSAAVARLKAAEADGLDPTDYPTPEPRAMGRDDDARAQDELRLTASVLTFARHAQSGRTIPTRISTNIEFSPPVPEPADILKKVSTAENVVKTLDSFNPTHAGFLALQKKLAELRGKTDAADEKTIQIPNGPTLRIGAKDARVPLLRERFGLGGERENIVFDAELAQAVKDFQKDKGLGADGLLGNRTVDALNGGKRSPAHDIDAVVSNMERWRWLPRELGQAYVMVNIPDFTLKVVRNNKATFQTKIVVGKPATPSPSFAATIETIQVNPTWHVPQSIIYGEYLPALKEDPSVLARMGLVMERNRDGTISIRQPPSERNALGRIKFNFPNKFQVYLHDTPDKNLFNHDRRAYSHGCMRVQNPTQFGEALAAISLPDENLTAARFQGMFGSGERWFSLKRKIPVYLTYMNAYVDDAGKLVVRPDLYGYDQRVQSALRGQYMVVSERSQRVSPVAIKRARQIVQEVPRQPQRGGFFLFPWFQ